jgi:hypothetical protein
MKSTDRLPFRRVLPITQLVLCALLLWPWRSFYILQFRSEAHVLWPTRFQQPVYHIADSLALVPPREHALANLGVLRLDMPALLNMPAVFTGVARQGAVPVGFLPDFWRSFSWPFLGIIFWWIVGRGIDALLAARSHVVAPGITWAETVVASLVTLGSAAGITAIIVDPSVRSDLILPWRWALASFGLWNVLGLVTILARVAQWRIRRQQRFVAAGVAAVG